MENKVKIQVATGIILSLSAILTSFLVSHEPNEEKKGIQSDKVLVVPIPDSVFHLDPRVQVSSALKGISNAIFSKLVKTTKDLEIEPDLLANWTFSQTSNELELNIRENAFFHNGKKVTSDDVIFSFHQWANKAALDYQLLEDISGIKEFWSGKLTTINGIKKISKSKLTLQLTFPQSDRIIAALSSPRFFVFPNEFDGQKAEAFFSKPTGSGPYKVDSVEPHQLKLTANDDFFDGMVPIQKLHFVQLSLEEAKAKMENQEVDALFSYSFSPKNLPKSNNIRSLPIPKNSTTVFVIVNQGKYKNRLARKHIQNTIKGISIPEDCVNRENLTDSIIPKGLPGYVETKPEKLDNLNLPSSIPNVFSSNQESYCLHEVLNSELALYKSKVVVASSLDSLFQSFLAGKIDLFMESISFRNLNSDSAIQYFNPSSPEYFLREPVQELTKLFEKLTNVKTNIERGDVLKEINSFLIAEAFVIPIESPQFYFPFNVSISGIEEAFYGNAANIAWQKLSWTEPK